MDFVIYSLNLLHYSFPCTLSFLFFSCKFYRVFTSLLNSDVDRGLTGYIF